MAKDVLFYSNHCRYSVEILQSLKETEYDRNIVKICVDNVPKGKIPAYIISVPTLLMVDSMRQIKDEELFQWISEQTRIAKKSEISPFQCGEMNCYSDSYSLVDGKNNFAQNFALVSGDNVPFVGENAKIDESKLNKSFDQYMAERDSDKAIGTGVKKNIKKYLFFFT